MKILVAPDKFKGSLTAMEAAQEIVTGWEEGMDGCDYSICPVADGGDGTLETIHAVMGGEWQRTEASNAQGHKRKAAWLWMPETRVAWIEIAKICGLGTLDPQTLDPLRATTAGVGQVICEAKALGTKRIYLCLGGSATNDAGCGMAAAMGYEFVDGSGNRIEPTPVELLHLSFIRQPQNDTPIEVIALTDVRNPLLGKDGASRIYGPQKGATAEDIEILEAALQRLSEVLVPSHYKSDAQMPGAGAAGGLGYGVVTFLGGRLEAGFEAIAQMMRLSEEVAEADIVITGEGRLDAQTSEGKAPNGVARLAKRHGKPVIAFVGTHALKDPAGSGFDAIIPISGGEISQKEAMRNAGKLLRDAARRVARQYQKHQRYS